MGAKMDMETTTAADQLRDIRVDHQVADDLVKVAASGLGDTRLLDRLDKDDNFSLRAGRMGQEIIIATTVAQTITAGAETVLDEALAKSTFSGQDQDLRAIGRALVARIARLARFPDDELSNELVASRFDKVLAAV